MLEILLGRCLCFLLLLQHRVMNTRGLLRFWNTGARGGGVFHTRNEALTVDEPEEDHDLVQQPLKFFFGRFLQQLKRRLHSFFRPISLT